LKRPSDDKIALRATKLVSKQFLFQEAVYQPTCWAPANAW